DEWCGSRRNRGNGPATGSSTFPLDRTGSPGRRQVGKHETRSSKYETRTEIQMTKEREILGNSFGPLCFEFVSDFVLRISDFLYLCRRCFRLWHFAPPVFSQGNDDQSMPIR